MLRRQRDRIAEPDPIGLHHARLGRAPLGLVRTEDDRRARAAQDIGKELVGRRQPDPRVNQEEAGISHAHGAFGQPPHPALQAVIRGLLQPGSIDHGEIQPAKTRLALTQVARHAGLIIDQRKALAHQPVEQGGFPDIRSPDNGQHKAHRPNSFSVSRSCRIAQRPREEKPPPSLFRKYPRRRLRYICP